MAQDVSPIERLEMQPVAVDPASIEAEFSRVWHETSGAGLDDSSVRLRVANIVVLARGDAERARFEEVMELLPQRHPCRGILALTDAERNAVEATISAHCWRSQGGERHICSEEVILLGGRGNERQMASAVLALLVADIPLTVWFPGALSTQGPLSEGLIDQADRIMFDSARAGDVLRVIETAERLREEHGLVCDDLAWLRLAGWRSLMAQLFDDAPGAAELSRIVRITIDGAPGASEPLLLAGWLIAQLGYTPADVTSAAGELRATLYAGSRAVTIVVSQHRDVPIARVALESPAGRFSVAWHADSGHLHVESNMDGGEPQRRVVAPTPVDDASMISMAFDGLSESDVHARSVSAIQGLFA